MISRITGVAVSSAQMKEVAKRLHDDEVMTILRNLAYDLGRLQKITDELKVRRTEQIMLAFKKQHADAVKPLAHDMLSLEKALPPPQIIQELKHKQSQLGKMISEQM